MKPKVQFEEGCYFDHGCRTVEELSQAIIDLAESEGFAPKFTEEESDDPEFWDWLEEEAIDYLNTHCADDAHYWGHDGDAGAFGYWKIEEESTPEVAGA